VSIKVKLGWTWVLDFKTQNVKLNIVMLFCNAVDISIKAGLAFVTVELMSFLLFSYKNGRPFVTAQTWVDLLSPPLQGRPFAGRPFRRSKKFHSSLEI
jgi:hypothetical protein